MKRQWKVFSHISECWQALRDAESVEEVEKLFEIFPRWSGDWEWYWSDDDFDGERHFRVENTYWNRQYNDYEVDWEDLDQFIYHEEEDE